MEVSTLCCSGKLKVHSQDVNCLFLGFTLQKLCMCVCVWYGHCVMVIAEHKTALLDMLDGVYNMLESTDYSFIIQSAQKGA